ncbi:MAG TPA: hypothetical protein ENO21_04015, partial [Firmicutes bacterium]|nr:hypothetical protein [Bacillota bacterium]
MRRVLEATPGVTLIEGEVGEILTAGNAANSLVAQAALPARPSSADVPSANSGAGAEHCSARGGADTGNGGPSSARPLQQPGGETARPLQQPVPTIADGGRDARPTEYVTGVRLTDGREYAAPRVVICPGTFTRAECFMGQRRHRAGRWGETSADALGESLERGGMPLQRLKTGTSPRIDSRSVDYT